MNYSVEWDGPGERDHELMTPDAIKRRAEARQSLIDQVMAASLPPECRWCSADVERMTCTTDEEGEAMTFARYRCGCVIRRHGDTLSRLRRCSDEAQEAGRSEEAEGRA